MILKNSPESKKLKVCTIKRKKLFIVWSGKERNCLLCVLEKEETVYFVSWKRKKLFIVCPGKERNCFVCVKEKEETVYCVSWKNKKLFIVCPGKGRNCLLCVLEKEETVYCVSWKRKKLFIVCPGKGRNCLFCVLENSENYLFHLFCKIIFHSFLNILIYIFCGSFWDKKPRLIQNIFLAKWIVSFVKKIFFEESFEMRKSLISMIFLTNDLFKYKYFWEHIFERKKNG